MQERLANVGGKNTWNAFYKTMKNAKEQIKLNFKNIPKE